MHYLEKLHGKDFRNYAGKEFGKDNEETPYLDFWHWMVDRMGIHNDGFTSLPEIHSDNPPWCNEILRYFEEFLGDDYYDDMYVSW